MLQLLNGMAGLREELMCDSFRISVEAGLLVNY